MPRIALVPSKHTAIHFTSRQAQECGTFCLWAHRVFLLFDAVFAIIGVQQFMQFLSHRNDLLIGKIVYGLIGLAIEAATYMALKSLVLRLSTYYATHFRMMSDKSVHGGMVEEQPEAAVIERSNSFYNTAYLTALIFSLGTNMFGLWGLIAEGLLPVVHTLAGWAHLGIGLAFILIFGILVSAIAHAGDFVGHHLLNQARTRELQEANLFNSAPAVLKSANPSKYP